MSSSSTKSNLVAFSIGAVAGGVAAILLAPDEGSRTRERIREGAKHAADKSTEVTKEKTGAVVDEAKKQVEAVKAAVGEGADTYRREAAKDAVNS